MNKRQTIAVIIGTVAAFAAVGAMPRPVPHFITSGPTVFGAQTALMQMQTPWATYAVFLGIAVLTTGAAYALRSRGPA